MKKLGFTLLAPIIILIDLAVVALFTTFVWPYFWPNGAFLVLTAGLAIVIWFPEFGYSIWMLRIVGLLLLFIGQSYIIHSWQVMMQYPSVLSVAHFIAITGMVIGMSINYVNQVRPKNRYQPPMPPPELPVVAVVIPTYGEPYEILERTVASIRKMDYPASRLFILISDDSHRREVQKMAENFGVHYNFGPKKDAKAGNLNSALAYLDQHRPDATLVLTQDADEVLHPSFLMHTVGYFNDPGVAFVQTPKEVIAPKGDPFGTRDRLFYDNLQVGRNGYGAAFACGSGVIWRIEAVKSIGGFSTWNVVEDLTTSYLLHSHGWRSEYHNERLSVGLAPDDIPGLLKQRGTWAVDTWRLFLFDNPLFKPGLTGGQRLQYFELGMFYVMSSFLMPVLMFIPLVSLATGQFLPIQDWALFPWVLICFLYYVILAQGRSLYMLRMWQYWIGHWPSFQKAFWLALRSRSNKPKYVVTRKTRDTGFYGHLIWQHFAFIVVSVLVILRALLWMPEIAMGTRLANIAVLLFFVFMVSAVVRAAFYGVPLFFNRRPQEV